jgi:hypothetical protein
VSDRRDRRRVPGLVSHLWCRSCKTQFAVAGRLRQEPETIAIELVVCPVCRALRRMVLPVTIGAPFREVVPGDRLREE